jgi:hypothetical protein
MTEYRIACKIRGCDTKAFNWLVKYVHLERVCEIVDEVAKQTIHVSLGNRYHLRMLVDMAVSMLCPLLPGNMLWYLLILVYCHCYHSFYYCSF